MSTQGLSADGKTYTFAAPDREQALILASGLAWAVGKLEGLDLDTGYAGQILEQWRNPIRVVPAKDAA